MPEPRKLRVFLCHASQDKPVVRELYRRLLAAPYGDDKGWIDPWLDEDKLLPGQDWDMEIEKAVENADAVIVCLSGNSVTKEGYIQKELRFVLRIAEEKPEGTIFVIPLRLEDCPVPRRLRDWQYVDYFPEARREVAYGALLKSIQLRARDFPSSPDFERTALPDPLSLAGMKFYRIAPGPFLMGSAAGNELADADEKPQHAVSIHYDYWMAQFPVTNEQYSVYVAAVGKSHPIRNWRRKNDHPVVRVSRGNAIAYCDWLNGVLKGQLPPGRVVRLPTEAEWEKAARGEDGREWPWGNQFSTGDKISDLNCHCKENKIGKTLPVDAYFQQGKSPYGIVDMVGNVWEWTCSLLRPYPYNPKDGRENPKTPGERVIRGGAYDKTIESVRCACRSRLNPSFKLPGVGFRLVIAPPISID